MARAAALAGKVDQVACGLTRLAGAALVGVVLWHAAIAAEPPWIWALGWSAVGAALVLLYAPVLRVIAAGLLVLACLLVVGTINPFAAMDLPAPVREQPDFALWYVARTLSGSALLVLLAYCVSRASEVRRRERAAA